MAAWQVTDQVDRNDLNVSGERLVAMKAVRFTTAGQKANNGMIRLSESIVIHAVKCAVCKSSRSLQECYECRLKSGC